MPRRLPTYSDFFYDPLTEDVEDLLARFQQTDSVRYEDFSAIWREMAFSDVFTGFTNIGEMKRFCRVALATAMKYFLPPYGYQIRVGGLYLMFGFYHTQFTTPPVNIRLALKDWTDIQSFLKDSLDSGHHDVVYIYQKLVATKAFHYTAMQHFLSFQKQRKPKKEAVCAEFLGRTTAVHELISADVVEEVANIQNHYQKLKEATEEVRGQVAVCHQDIASRLTDCMSEFIKWQQKTFSLQVNKGKKAGDEDEDDDDDDDVDEEEDEEERQTEEESCSRRARLLSSIKQKSYSNFQEASKSRRHRQAETVDMSSSGPEQVQETAARQRKRAPSLRARTWKSLQVTKEDSELQAWLLSVPEQQRRMPVKRTNQTRYKP